MERQASEEEKKRFSRTKTEPNDPPVCWPLWYHLTIHRQRRSAHSEQIRWEASLNARLGGTQSLPKRGERTKGREKVKNVQTKEKTNK
jgi:hypothetical protein